MNHRTLAVTGITILLVTGTRARAQDDDEAEKPAAKALQNSVSSGRAAKADDTDDVDEEPTVTKAAPLDAASRPAAVTTPDFAPFRPPTYGRRGDWFIAPYGYARLDAIEDSTQSFADGIEPNLIARVGTKAGDHPRSNLSARDSRLGIFVGAPTFQGIRSSAQVEFDFFGLEPTDARQNDTVIFATPRLRHAFLKFETSVVDVIAGQTYDLFGWAPFFYPATVAYLGVPGQIYHRNPQLRIEKKLSLGSMEITGAIAGVKGGERDSGVPDAQVGLRIAFNGWKGAAMPGFWRPVLAPLSIGVSGLYRHFSAPAFNSGPGSEVVTANGYGLAASLLLPIIPLKSIDDRSNALTVAAEFSTGSGIADMYTGMDGGSRFPLLPNAQMLVPAPIYQADVDPGLVTFDRNSDLKTITWNAVVANVQYYLPIGWGRAWLSGTYSRTWSPNLLDLTPFTSYGAIFTKMEYFDANIGFDITPAIVVALSFQTVQQTFGDVTSPTPTYVQDPVTGLVPNASGTGGDPVTARNNRGQISVALFF